MKAPCGPIPDPDNLPPVSGGGKVNVPNISRVIRQARSAARRRGWPRRKLAIRPGDVVYVEARGYEGCATGRGIGDGELVFTPLVTIWDPASAALSRLSWHGARSRLGSKARR